MNIFKKCYNKLHTFFIGLVFGMKHTEDEIFTQFGAANEISGTTINQNIQSNRISKALLKGEVTQEVEDLRYRTYLVDREAKKYEYYAPTLAIKKENKDNKFVKYENSDNLEIITIQPNSVETESVEETLQQVGNYGKSTNYLIKIGRNFVSRYKIEEYCKRLVVRKLNDTHAMLDFYVSIYPNDKDFKSKGFVKEVEKIKNNGLRSDILEINMVSFVTSHAYNLPDMIRFEFNNVFFKEVVEYDGHYIIRFKSSIFRNGIDLTNQYYSKRMDDRYKNKEKKEVTVNLFDCNIVETYVCEHCGKKITYDEEEMNFIPIMKPRDIDEEIEEVTNVTEYMDIQMAEQTIGKRLCKNCLKKYLEENNYNIN